MKGIESELVDLAILYILRWKPSTLVNVAHILCQGTSQNCLFEGVN